MSEDDFDPGSVTWVLGEADLGHLCSAIETCVEVVMDLETTGLDEHAPGARIAMASLTLPQEGELAPTTWVVPLSHPDSPWLGQWVKVMRRVALCIKESGKPLVNQNVKFDCRWTKAHTGVDLSHQIAWDPMASSHLLDENESTKLKDRAPATFGIERWDEGFDLSIPGEAERVPMFDLGVYAARDTYWVWRLVVQHREQLLGHERPETQDEVELARLGRLATWCVMPTIATLTAVEQRGMNLDRDWTQAELAVHRRAARALVGPMAERYAGLDPEDVSFAPTSIWFQEWAARAVDAGDLTIAELTPTGKPRWSKAVLVRQARAGSEVAQQILDYRGHMKKAEFLASWLAYQTPLGLVHASYNAGRVVTGRLSSSEPNMQQVTAMLKSAWVPSPGYVLADFDYGQIEMRCAAQISGCVPMIEAFRRGDDLHKLLAAQITGKNQGIVTPVERQAGKAGNFGFLFGMGAYGFREYAETNYGVSFTLEEAHAVRRAFFDTWDGLSEWHARAVLRAQQTGQVVSPMGRVRRLPAIWDANEAYASFAERQAINSPVQGFASDIMQVAAASIEGTLPGHDPVEQALIVGTVHDSILVEVPADSWKEVVLACQQRMLDVGPTLARMDCVLDVPLAVDVKVGTRWGLSDIAVLS